MKFKFAVLVLCLCCDICLSCSRNDSDVTCGVSDPIEELGWLNEAVAELQNNDSDVAIYLFVSQGTYEGQTVFVFDNCCPICNTAVFVFNCEGENIGQLNSDIKRDEIQNRKIIYRSEDFSCNDA